jgi:peptide/nickel transport system substrate-binding protein
MGEISGFFRRFQGAMMKNSLIDHSMKIPFSFSRTRPFLVAALALMLLTATSMGQRKEEEEDPKDKAKAPLPMPVPKPAEAKEKKDAIVPGGPEPVDLGVGSMTQESTKATHPAGRDLFKLLAVPYDRLTSTFAGGKILNVAPLAFRELPEEEFTIFELAADKIKGNEKSLATGSGFVFVPYELICLEYVESFLNRKQAGMSRAEQMDYAARAIACALRFHGNALANNKRVGKGWDAVGIALKTRLVRLQREQFAMLVEEKQFEKADDLGLKLFARNPDDVEIQKDINGLQLLRTTKEIRTLTLDESMKLRQALLQYERLPGAKNNILIAETRQRLRNRAAELIGEAKRLDDAKQPALALAKLREAEAIEPDLPGINDVRFKLRGRVLYVGVPQLPERMSPPAATTDVERWAAELMFEGLLNVVPDPELTHYRPGLAVAMPGVTPLGRSFALPKNIRWAPHGDDAKSATEILDVRDIRGTLMLLKKPGQRERAGADGLEIFREIDRVEDPFRLRLAYERGVPDPLRLATFKVLPARYLLEAGRTADDESFARAPFGSGPYCFEGFEKEAAGRDVAVFRANPYYGQRTGRFGLPNIREIRFFVPNQSTVITDVNAGQLHLLPDCPPEIAARFPVEENLREVMRAFRVKENRRIHILAINHRRPDMQNERLRQGISAAIDRESILKNLFRQGEVGIHRSLTGPFPVDCWATPEAARGIPLFKPGAGGLISEGIGEKVLRLKLVHFDDQKTGQACQMIKNQIEAASMRGDKPMVQIDTVPLAAEPFRIKIQLERDYDLAYLPFDYRDHLYSLGSFLDPGAGERQGRNTTGYLAAGSNPTEADRRVRRLMEEIAAHRDFAQIREKTWDLHAMFNQRVPFVPLWQLDRTIVTHRDLEIFTEFPDFPVNADRLDLATLFNGVEMWKLK